jgi:hypothetical protein
MHAELLLPDSLCSFEQVSDLEEPLDQRLIAAGAGEVLGGGIGSGWYRFDLEISNFQATVDLLKSWAHDLDLPEGSCLRHKTEQTIAILVPDSSAN